MGSFAMAIPIIEGKTDEWVAWAKSMTGEQKQAAGDLYRKHGIDRTRCWIQHTPDGDMAVVLHEGPGADAWLRNLGSDDSESAAWFKDKVRTIHGMDPDNPPPGLELPELMVDWRD